MLKRRHATHTAFIKHDLIKIMQKYCRGKNENKNIECETFEDIKKNAISFGMDWLNIQRIKIWIFLLSKLSDRNSKREIQSFLVSGIDNRVRCFKSNDCSRTNIEASFKYCILTNFRTSIRYMFNIVFFSYSYLILS